MSQVTFSPVVYAQYKRQDGNYVVKMRITHNRSSRLITTSERATPSQLTRSLKIKDPALQDRLRKLEQKMRDAMSDLDMFDLDNMTVDDVLAHIRKRINGSFQLDFLAFWPEAVADKKAGTREMYIIGLHSFKAFLGADSLDISKVTARLMRNYEAWLVKKHGQGARAVTMYTACVRHVHALARKKYNDDEFGEALIRNPFEFYTPPKSRQPKHRNVEPSVIQTMIDTRSQLSGLERRAVDAFLLSFALMGMNCPDLISCAPPKDGVLIYCRQKTRDRRSDRAEMHVLIDDRILPIYNEYKASDGKHAFLFYRYYSNYRQMNCGLADGLRQYRTRMGIPQGGLEFYSARHTWASTAYSAGVDKHTINDCLCHTDTEMRVTDIYINKDWSVMWKANTKVLDEFKWPD